MRIRKLGNDYWWTSWDDDPAHPVVNIPESQLIALNRKLAKCRAICGPIQPAATKPAGSALGDLIANGAIQPGGRVSWVYRPLISELLNPSKRRSASLVVVSMAFARQMDAIEQMLGVEVKATGNRIELNVTALVERKSRLVTEIRYRIANHSIRRGYTELFCPWVRSVTQIAPAELLKDRMCQAAA